jgi:Tol biopolymer transport system component
MDRKQKRLTPDALLGFSILSDAQISPDGDSVAYVSGELVVDNSKLSKRHIWLVDANGKNSETVFEWSAR